MKFLIAFVALVAVATASGYDKPVGAIDIDAIIAAINHPSTDPATAAHLMDLLQSILQAEDSPISVGPAIVDEDSPISVGPAIVEEAPAASVPSSPLVQIIINVNGQAVGNPVVVEQPNPALPEIVPTPVIVAEQPEIESESVIVSPVIIPTPVEVVEHPEISPEPVIIAPIETAPAMVLPEILN